MIKNNDIQTIERLLNCYVLSQNLNGGVNNKLSFQIKKKINKKIAKLILHKNYLKDLEGGAIELIGATVAAITIEKIVNEMIQEINNNNDIKSAIQKVLRKYFRDTKVTDLPFFDPWTPWHNAIAKKSQPQSQYQPLIPKHQQYQQPQQHQQHKPQHQQPHPFSPIQDFLNLFK
jgi:hypothetical protein